MENDPRRQYGRFLYDSKCSDRSLRFGGDFTRILFFLKHCMRHFEPAAALRIRKGWMTRAV